MLLIALIVLYSAALSDGQLNKFNLKFDCTYEGTAICCAALESKNFSTSAITKTRGIGNGYGEQFIRSHQAIKQIHKIMDHHNCKIHKEYVPSRYEINHMAKAKELLAIENRQERKNQLLEFVQSPEQGQLSRQWIKLIQLHMQSEAVPHVSSSDAELLSKFIVTRTCYSLSNHSSSSFNNAVHDASMRAATKRAGISDWRTIHMNISWEEWIEPLSVHARHPFSFHGEYSSISAMPADIPIEEYVALESADHVLLQSAASLYNNTIPNYGQLNGEVARHFFFDAGVSQFKTALQWFTCGYSQRKISFDQIYGWELRLQPPEKFWKEVPPLWKPYFHFLNVPVSAETTHPDSPLRFIKQLATEDDFVSFKLDIDHTATEIPIAQMILSDPELTKLVDEFFFELHFDCELLGIPWHDSDEGPKINQYGNLTLDRYHALEFFQNFRKAGIRSHFWP